MSTLEEFENAPIGATASDPDGRTAVKTPHKEWPWSLFDEDGERIAHASNHHMATQGWTLDPTPAVPATAREALDLAWELAHPVKEGQVIPKGARAIDHSGGTVDEYIAGGDWVPRDPANFRTLDPLPEPTPDWLDAPAVLANVVGRAVDYAEGALQEEYGGYQYPAALRIAQALADAGLLAQPIPTQQELADTIYDSLEEGGWLSTTYYPYDIADAVLELLEGTKK